MWYEVPGEFATAAVAAGGAAVSVPVAVVVVGWLLQAAKPSSVAKAGKERFMAQKTVKKAG